MAELLNINIGLQNIQHTLQDLREMYPIPTVQGTKVIDPNQLSVVIYGNDYTDTVEQSKTLAILNVAEQALNAVAASKDQLRIYMLDKLSHDDPLLGQLEARLNFLMEDLLKEVQLKGSSN